MKLLLLLIAGCTALSLPAQMEVSVFAGVSDYNGDLLDKPYRFSRPAAGLRVGYQLSNRFTLAAAFTYGKLEGADSINTTPGIADRNLSFQSELKEYAMMLEYHLFNLEAIGWTPFAFAGLGVYQYSPYTFDKEGNKHYLQPLGTEGQGLPQYPARQPYKLTNFAVPLGGGIKVMLNEHLQLAALIGLRLTNNDYLDDVSLSYAGEEDLRTARGDKAVELSYRAAERNPAYQVYPDKTLLRGRNGSLLYSDFYYFSGLHLTYCFGKGSGSTFAGQSWKPGRYGCFRM